MDNPTDKKRLVNVKVTITYLDEATEKTSEAVLYDKKYREGVDEFVCCQNIDYAFDSEGQVVTKPDGTAVVVSRKFTLTTVTKEK